MKEFYTTPGSHGEEQEQTAEGTAWKPFSENLIKTEIMNRFCVYLRIML